MEVGDSPCRLADGGKKCGEIPPHFQSSVLPQVKIRYVSHIKRENDCSRLACLVAGGLNNLIRLMAA